MINPDWKYAETVKKKIRITRINKKERHVDATDLEINAPLCMNANEKIDLGKIKKAKIYQATIKIFRAELSPELESQMIESALNDINRLKAIRAMKASGFKPSKFELVEITH